MNFEQELKKVAARYAGLGFEVFVRPGAEQLPSFAKDFKIEILGRRTDQSVLVSVKKDRMEMAADLNMPRYAEVTSAQPGWRFDFVILEAEQPRARDAAGAQDFSGEDIRKTLSEAEQMVRIGFDRAAIITAWAALESAMRMRLRAEGEEAGWGTMPRSMLNELFSSGVLTGAEFARLENLSQVRNQIVHGFASPSSNADIVPFVIGLTKRLVDESHPMKQPA